MAVTVNGIPNPKGEAILIVAIVSPFIAAIFVALRVYARAYLLGSFAWDDWCSIFTLVMCIAYSIVIGLSTYHGMGLKTEQFTPEIQSAWLYWVLIMSEFYCAALMGYKMCLLLLYHRLFSVYRAFRYINYFVMFMTCAYLFANIITEWASCAPIHKFWDIDIPGHCTNAVVRDVAYGVFNVVTDFAIAILPLPMIWRLNLRTKSKALLTVIFISAVVAFAVATIRYIYAFIDLHSNDRLTIAGTTFLLSILEVNTGLICGCTPTFKPLFHDVRERARSFSLYRKKSRSTNDSELDPEKRAAIEEINDFNGSGVGLTMHSEMLGSIDRMGSTQISAASKLDTSRTITFHESVISREDSRTTSNSNSEVVRSAP